MQPLQRSYGITGERIQNMLQTTSVKNFYDPVKYQELEAEPKLSAKDKKKLDKFKKNYPFYKQMLDVLKSYESDNLYKSSADFEPILHKLLDGIIEKRLFNKILDGLSKMDKNAKVQTDKKGNIKYDKETSDTEIVNINENIDEYMQREVLPFVPDAKAFFEENLGKKKPVIKTGAEIPFTRYFYKYEKPKASEKLLNEIKELEKHTEEKIGSLFELEQNNDLK